ncbi:succinate dehydrogenase assembly factor 3, mitochondrial-like [Amphiura filiformis]|uniref:succinate dehydrogenase assembly factor 3, mitochondrial-like n=1 Tax=Amphiura filiformis TaxID=82378 RepID=UPI003B20E638
MSRAHVSIVRSLYKRILVLHRYLPLELQAVGDEYVKAEFRRHKDVPTYEAAKFMVEWKNYADTLSEQVNPVLPSSADQKPVDVGQHLDDSVLDNFKQEQLEQLYELAKETNKPYVPPDQQS